MAYVRRNNMNTVGIFYQSAQPNPCYYAIKQLRSVDANVPVTLFDDGANQLENIAKQFNCYYRYGDKIGNNNLRARSNIHGIESLKVFLDRLYISCTNELSSCDYIILYEDDVWCLRPIREYPKYDIAGHNCVLYSPWLQHYLWKIIDPENWQQLVIRGVGHPEGTLYGSVLRGGGIFSRTKFIDCYNNLSKIDLITISRLDANIINYANMALSLLFQINGFSAGFWSEVREYVDETSLSKDISFVHGYKKYYI